MRDETKFAHMGRPKPDVGTAVNPDIKRASTLLFAKAEDLYRTDVRAYGRHGNPVQDQVETMFTALEDGAGTSVTPSGFSACTLAILSHVHSGDHILVSDSCYGPTRNFCQTYLKRLGIEAEFYDPRIGENISTLIRKNTSLIFMESPGSLTFELHDIPAICKVAQSHKIVTALDNTWSGGISLNPLRLGVDMSIHSATKYVGGHSDILYGAVVSASEEVASQVSFTRKHLGTSVSPDSSYQILRGFRTLHTRFATQEDTALKLASWLSTQAPIEQILHPALPDFPDHEIWKRDFTGAACLFGFTLKPYPEPAIMGFINGLKYFGIGFSYGGYESVIIHCNAQLKRAVSSHTSSPLLRIGCGLESFEDLKDDIEQSMKANL